MGNADGKPPAAHNSINKSAAGDGAVKKSTTSDSLRAHDTGRCKKIFAALTGTNDETTCFNEKHLLAAFGDMPDLHTVMHEHFFASATNLPLADFVHKCRPLVVDALTCVRSISVEKMIMLCARASNVAVTDKEASVRALAATVHNVPNLLLTLPRIANDLRSLIDARLNGEHDAWSSKFRPSPAESSAVGECEYWLAQSALSPVYFTARATTATASTDISNQPAAWTLLYSSDTDGLSTNRFENKVFSYRGCTATFIRIGDGRLYCIAVDKEWRSSITPFGGLDTCAVRLLPTFERIDSVTVCMNTLQQRTSYRGLIVRDDAAKTTLLQVPATLDDVVYIEVYGCASGDTLEAQRQQKLREARSRERQQEVPLPGKWDENPDRSLLEMAGVGAFAHADHMREAVRRDDDKPE